MEFVEEEEDMELVVMPVELKRIEGYSSREWYEETIKV